jgi:cytochrome P450
VVTNVAQTLAPGPPGPLGNLLELRGDRLGFLVRAARAYGGVVRIPVGLRELCLVSDPAGVKRVLQDNVDNYGRDTRSFAALRDTLGDSLLTITGERWRRNRRLAQPAFHKQRLAGFAAVMSECAAAAIERWKGRAARGGAFDVAPEMARLTLQILGRCIFQRDLTDEADAIGRALTVVLHHTVSTVESLLPVPKAIPTPANRRFRQALRELDRVVMSLIEERRRSGEDRGDLLSMLLEARDEATGEGLTDRQLRDEVMTLLLAGHETTAMSLSWTLLLLSQHPAVRRAVEAEARQVLGGRRPAVEDLPRLRATRMAIEESMRLYPPAWIVTRSVEAPDEIAGHPVTPGMIVVLSPYVTHRDPALWENPEGFDPERFAPEREAERAARPRYAYFPFGGGPHLCIGAGFAMMEAEIILSSIAASLRVDLEPGRPIEVEPLVTLRPKYGIWVGVRTSTSNGHDR